MKIGFGYSASDPLTGSIKDSHDCAFAVPDLSSCRELRHDYEDSLLCVQNASLIPLFL